MISWRTLRNQENASDKRDPLLADCVNDRNPIWRLTRKHDDATRKCRIEFDQLFGYGNYLVFVFFFVIN